MIGRASRFFAVVLLAAAEAAAQHPRVFFTSGDVPALRQKAQTTHAEIWQSIKKDADASLERRLRELYEAREWWYQDLIQNHFTTANSALGMGALALEGEAAQASAWLTHAQERLARKRALMDGIGDGSWHEGMGYQNYDLTLYLPFLHSLRRLKSKDLYPHAYLRNHALWRAYNVRPGSKKFVMTFGDFNWSWAASKEPIALRFIASEYRNGVAEWAAQEMLRNHPRGSHSWEMEWFVFEFFYYDPSVAPRSPQTLPLDRAFADLEGVIWRTGWGASDLTFALKAGPYGGRFAHTNFIQGAYPFTSPGPFQFNHGHDDQDAGTFYLYRGSDDLSSESEGYHNNHTRFHNTLLVDGKGQYVPAKGTGHYRYPDRYAGADPELERVLAGRTINYLAADLTRVYRDQDPATHRPGPLWLDEFRRHVLFIKPDYLVMVDNVRASSPRRYEWVAHFGSGVSVQGDWIKGDGTGGRIAGVKVLSPSGFAHSTGNDGKPYVRVRPPSNVPSTRFVTLLYPADSASWPARPGASLLADTGKAVGVRVARGGGEDHLIRYLGTGTLAVGDYVFEARTAGAMKDSGGKLTRLFLGEGTRLADGKGARDLLTAKSLLTAEAEFSGDALALHGQGLADAELRVYAPAGVDPSKVTVNGSPAKVSRSGAYLRLGGDTVPPAAPRGLRGL